MSDFADLEDWSDEGWSPEAIDDLIARVVEDYRQNKFSRDFEDKLSGRKISLQTMIATVTSRDSFIVEYRDDKTGLERIGFWHPRFGIFVAWQSEGKTQFVSAFRRRDGRRYLQDLWDAAPVRWPEVKR